MKFVVASASGVGRENRGKNSLSNDANQSSLSKPVAYNYNLKPISPQKF